MIKHIENKTESNAIKIFDFLKAETEPTNFEAIQGYSISGNSINITVDVGEKSLSQKLSFRILDKANRDTILNYISSNPLLAEEILAGNLPDSFINTLLMLDVPILPFKKEEISVKGKLPPLVQRQVLHYITSLINEDKCLVLELKGLSFDELISAANKAEIVGSLQNFSYTKDYQQRHSDVLDTHSSYSLEPQGSEDIFFNIPTNPIHFEKKDFKYKLIEIYDLISTEFDSVFIDENNVPVRKTNFYIGANQDNTFEFYASPTTNFEYYIKSKGSLFKCKRQSISLPILENENISFKDSYALLLDKELVYDYFLSFNTLIENEDFSKTSTFINKLTLFAKEIVRNLYIKPQVEEIGKDHFTIKYIPDYSNTKLRNVVNILESVMPTNIGFLKNSDNLITKSSLRPLLNDIVNYVTYKLLQLKGKKIKSNPISNIFVQNKPVKSTKHNKNICKSIRSWLKYLDIKNQDFRLLVVLDKLSDEMYEASIEIQTKELINKKLIDLFESDTDKELIDNIATKISAASEYIPILKDIYISNATIKPAVRVIDIIKLSANTYANLGNLGIEILIPKELKNIIKPKASVKAKLKDESNIDIESMLKNNMSVFSLDDIMEFQYEISLGDEKISKEEFLDLIKNSDELIKYKDKYILLKPEEIQKIVEQLNKPIKKELNTLQLIHSSFSGMVGDIELDYDEMIKTAINNHLQTKEITVPDNLNGTLRAYQENGFKWLYSNIEKGFGCCIADDMGLGKTIQVLSLLLQLKNEKKLSSPALVVCPTTLVGNWKKECEHFAPSLNASIYHGSDRTIDKNSDIIITTYGLLRIDKEEFEKTKWSLIIIDEAQNIKNPNTSQSKAVKSMTADYHIAMTGTPIENKLTELWSIFDFINKDYLGSIGEFQNNYSVPIERFKEQDTAEKLKLVTSPFILRRLKTDKSVINDLPDKLTFDEYCYLTPEQAALYEKTLNSTMNSLQDSTGINRKGNVLKLITSLKQICNHPTNYLKNNNYNIDISGKTQKTISILEKILENNEKALIFTQYKEMGAILQKVISNELSQETLFFHGSLTRNHREELINKFQNDVDTKLMVLSLKAGGTGLNLTAATNVIHYDLWWNPAIENQATDRTYRIGQTQNVTVHRLITIGTFEEKIDEMLRSKKQLVDLSLHTGEKMITEMSDEELFEIFSLRE